ncbi:MAG: phospho-N-acetylmuramoyl-pentapeptide-transferase [Clostridia bacterium]|nr:phospho-N-acetylmuramoyl-pentapeptide-transferase [Clostridia bacterium]
MSFISITLLIFVLSLCATVLGLGVLLPVLQEKKMGQTILEIGPRWHKSKEGTPTMGGISFFLAVSLAVLLGCLFLPLEDGKILLLALSFALLNGFVGVIDDLQKLKRHENAGLAPWQKLVLQTVIAVFFVTMLAMEGSIDTTISLPFTSHVVPLGSFYYFLAVFVIVGVVNSANLTDGIDGLATSVGFLIGGFLALEGSATDNRGASLLGASMAGSSFGFLFYNHHPAQIFMGDSGSLFLGALAVGGAFLLGHPLLILLFGLVYIVEGFSVVLQVLYFKMTKKRLFKMAPFHHHLEKSGLDETEIVSLFSFLTLIAAVSAHFLLLL